MKSLGKCGILLAFSYAICAPALALQYSGPFVEKARSEGEGTAYTPEGKVRIELGEIWVQAADFKGRPWIFSLIVYFEPMSGAFGWGTTYADTEGAFPSAGMKRFGSEKAVYLKGDEFFEFGSSLVPTELIVSRSRGHARNVYDAEQQAFSDAKTRLDPQLPELERGGRVRVVTLICLGLDFSMIPGHAELPGTIPKVTNVQWDEERHHWVVRMRERWTAVITFDEDYNILAIKREDYHPGFPEDSFRQTPAPKLSLPAGTYTQPQTVEITDTDPAAKIYYTTDGSTPKDWSSSLYSGPLTVTTTETIRAIATEANSMNSDVSAATYEITQ